MPDNADAALSAWDELRAAIRAAGLPDPGAMDDAEYHRLLRDGESTHGEESGPAGPQLEFLAQGGAEYEPFEAFDVVTGRSPAYREGWPVVAVEESGAIAVSLPRELLPHLAGLRIRDGLELCPLGFLDSVVAFRADAGSRATTDALRGVEPEPQPAGPAAKGHVPEETARRLLMRRR
ncbi:hypothetical protein BE17_42220 [Sorangium cellulosum]|uniref:Uncharacterized protein n=1 Tax=Sorangium cellulosum TaxID=56 RepID=A0A150SPV8_SORCE|nr:hypothetical protein BE17_42220 [Sorangium cellulosum]